MTTELPQIQKFNGDNFHLWKFQMKIILEAKDLLSITDGSEVKPEIEDIAKFSNWKKKDAKSKMLITTALEFKYLQQIVNYQTSADMWKKLSTIYELKSETNKYLLQQRFFEYKMNPNDNIATHISKVETLAQQMKDLGEPISDVALITKIICSLPDKYKNFITAWDLVSSEEKTLENLTARLLKEESLQDHWDSSGNSKPDNALMTFSKLNRNSTASNKQQQHQQSIKDKKKNTHCGYCKKKGHWWKECYKRKEEQKGQQPSSSARDDSCAFSAETSAFLAETKDSWIADSEATDHMTFRREWFSTFEEIPEGVHPVCLGDGKKIYAKGKGNIDILSYVDSQEINATLLDVLYIPELETNLFPISTATKHGLTLICKGNQIKLTKKSRVLVTGIKDNSNLYRIFIKAKQSSQTHVAQLSLDIWHQRMGHVNPIKLTQMFENNVFEENIKIREKPDSLLCEACIYGKQNRKVFHASTSPNSTYPGELIYSDVCGPMSKRSPGGSLHFVSFKDDFSRFRVAYFIRHKSDVFEKFKEFVKRVRTETGNKIKRFRTDNGTEFLNKNFSDYLKSLGIVHELTAPFTPEQNGISERDNRTIVESARCLLHGRKMPLELWAEAVNTAVYLLNRCTTKVLGNSTPYEIWNRIREKEQTSTSCTRAISYACYVHDQEPLNYEDAIVGQNSKQWKLAMDDEFNSLMKNQTWTYVTLPSDRKAIACKWVYKIKQNADGSNKMFKARLVAKGYSQKPGLDYGETFSPVVKFDSIRTILSLCALLDMEMIQLDVKSAFLNGDLEEELYMEQPQGYENPDFPNHVCSLQKSIYGLKQSPRMWNKKFHEFLIKFDLKPSISDSCVYTMKCKQAYILLAIYVDDCLICSVNKQHLDDIVQYLNSNFEIKTFTADYFLGLQIYRDRTTKILFLHQASYIERTLEHYNLLEIKLQSVPSDPYSKLTKKMCPTDNQEIEEMNKIPYRQTIGSLMYLMTGTRPDIAYAVSRVSQFMNNPGPSYWTAVKKIFGYLKATKNIGICFGGSSCTTSLIGFSDADFAGDLDTRKSTTGNVFMLNNGPISWCSQKQNCVSLSTTESEYIAASKATKEAIWLRQLLRDLHQEQVKPTTFFCDNQSCIRLVHNPEYHKRTKHIDISYHFIRDHFQNHAIDLLYVCSNDQAADIFTKALPPERYRRLRSQLGLFETTECSLVGVSGRGMAESMVVEGVLLWRGDRSWADLVLGEVGGSFISVVGDHFFRVTVQRLARKGVDVMADVTQPKTKMVLVDGSLRYTDPGALLRRRTPPGAVVTRLGNYNICGSATRCKRRWQKNSRCCASRIAARVEGARAGASSEKSPTVSWSQQARARRQEPAVTATPGCGPAKTSLQAGEPKLACDVKQADATIGDWTRQNAPRNHDTRLVPHTKRANRACSRPMMVSAQDGQRLGRPGDSQRRIRPVLPGTAPEPAALLEVDSHPGGHAELFEDQRHEFKLSVVPVEEFNVIRIGDHATVAQDPLEAA
ncbi:hypothetical protein LAZ67_1003272 [Cordylochernes scorpioides]|uniref:Integrase catalytic domain-containing protein n=1 Tax=Cordylochernes scorpioides TaxID=51811 RepID=A0ABY6JYF1_9ARAC|nr:hypothetical protein LAZ67_1003272 [Cordylochernes scorpioides]